MGCDFYFTKPGKRRVYGGTVEEPFDTKLPARDFRMGYVHFSAMRYRLFSLANVRFGLIWWVFVTWCRGNESMLYPADADMMHDIERSIPRALVPLATQGDTDSALSSKEVERLSFALRSPDTNLAADIEKYSIALPPLPATQSPPIDIDSCKNYGESPDLLRPDLDVNCKMAKDCVEQFARVVCEAARLGFGLQW